MLEFTLGLPGQRDKPGTAGGVEAVCLLLRSVGEVVSPEFQLPCGSKGPAGA